MSKPEVGLAATSNGFPLKHQVCYIWYLECVSRVRAGEVAGSARIWAGHLLRPAVKAAQSDSLESIPVLYIRCDLVSGMPRYNNRIRPHFCDPSPVSVSMVL